MTSYTAYYVLMQAVGQPDAVAAFVQRHLARRNLSFGTLRPVPAGLEEGFPSDVEDAFDALFGDWTKVAGRHRFMEIAQSKGFAFPLESRDQVVACHEALEPHGPEALRRARVYQQNREQHGAGQVSQWCKLHWGVDVDATRTVAQVETSSVTVSFELGGAPGDKLLRLFSTEDPGLDFDTCYVTASGKRPNSVAFKAGKKCSPAGEPGLPEVQAWIAAFRRRCGLQWLSQWVSPELVARTVSMDDQGNYFLQGHQTSLDFAMSRLRAGESPASLQQRFPYISDEQVRLITDIHAADQ
jgi:hypothetical protein